MSFFMLPEPTHCTPMGGDRTLCAVGGSGAVLELNSIKVPPKIYKRTTKAPVWAGGRFFRVSMRCEVSWSYL